MESKLNRQDRWGRITLSEYKYSYGYILGLIYNTLMAPNPQEIDTDKLAKFKSSTRLKRVDGDENYIVFLDYLAEHKEDMNATLLTNNYIYAQYSSFMQICTIESARTLSELVDKLRLKRLDIQLKDEFVDESCIISVEYGAVCTGNKEIGKFIKGFNKMKSHKIRMESKDATYSQYDEVASMILSTHLGEEA